MAPRDGIRSFFGVHKMVAEKQSSSWDRKKPIDDITQVLYTAVESGLALYVYEL